MNPTTSFKMMPLPFAVNALEYISAKTMDAHYNRNYKSYIDKTNELVGATDKYDGMTLEEVVVATLPDMQDPLFQQAAQAYNHEFYWKSLTDKKTAPGPKTLSLIQRSFGSLEKLKQHANDKALSHFGSGWLWLNLSKVGLTVETTHDADNFLDTDRRSLMCIDLWEHAFTLDHLNDKKAYLAASWNCVNWDFVEQNL